MFRTPDNIYRFWQSQMVSRVEVTRCCESDVRHGESLRLPAIGRSTEGAYHRNNNCASLENFYRNLDEWNAKQRPPFSIVEPHQITNGADVSGSRIALAEDGGSWLLIRASNLAKLPVCLNSAHYTRKFKMRASEMFVYETKDWNALTEEQRSAILKEAHESEEVISIDGQIFSSAPTFDGRLALHPRLGIDEEE